MVLIFLLLLQLIYPTNKLGVAVLETVSLNSKAFSQLLNSMIAGILSTKRGDSIFDVPRVKVRGLLKSRFQVELKAFANLS